MMMEMSIDDHGFQASSECYWGFGSSTTDVRSSEYDGEYE
jgi:hypothetical protein